MLRRRARMHLTSATFIVAVIDAPVYAFMTTGPQLKGLISPLIGAFNAVVMLCGLFGSVLLVKEVSSLQGVRWFLLLLAAILFGVGLVREAVAQPVPPKVASIEIRGNKKIELPAIQGRLTLKPGDPYTAENVRGQIKILYDTGFFEEVQVETETVAGGGALAFLVREKTFITEIVFDGKKAPREDKNKKKNNNNKKALQ